MHCKGKLFAWCDCPCTVGRKAVEIDALGSMQDVCEECVEATAKEICICSETDPGYAVDGFPCPIHPMPETF